MGEYNSLGDKILYTAKITCLNEVSPIDICLCLKPCVFLKNDPNRMNYVLVASK